MATISSINHDNGIERLGSCTSGLTQFRMRLPVEELELGMRVDELDKPWLESSFLFQGFFIESEADLQALRRECSFVYVTVTREVAANTRGAVRPTGTKAKAYGWTGSGVR